MHSAPHSARRGASHGARRGARGARRGAHGPLGGIGVVALSLVLVACNRSGASSADTTPLHETHTTMGSLLEISVSGGAPARSRTAIAQAFHEVDRLDGLMSVWKEGSEIQRLNAAAGEHPVPVGPDLMATLSLAKQIGDLTGGKFDVTFAALSGLWKFDAQNEDDRIPDPTEVAERVPLIDYQQLELDPARQTAFLKKKGMSVNLGGIGKGYAVDRVAEILRREGLQNFMIQFGGDLYVAGLHEGRPWTLGIRDPRGPADKPFASIALTDSTFSTSGDYERFFMAEGRRYHHILDPDTGQPARGCRSVTILARQAAMADALDTGVFVMGPEAGMALVERLPDVEAVIVTDHNEVLVSSGLKDRLTILAQPTDAP